MLRQNDPVLHHVDRSLREYTMKMDDGRMGCKFCGTIFVKDTSITRIKFHLAALAASDGVRICGKVPQDVQDAALAAIDGPPEKKLTTGAGSSNNEVTNAISASAQQQRNEMMMAHQQEDLSLEDWMASITIEDEELQVIGNFHERPSFNQADEPRGDPSQPTNDQLCSPSINNDVIMNDAQNVAGVRTEPVVQVLEQSNAERDNLSMDAGRMQVGIQGMEQGGEEGRVCSHLDMENTGEGSTQHVDRIVPPTIDENYNGREATERLVQHGVVASSFGVYGNHDAISTSQQEQNNEVDNLTVDGARIQEPNIYAKSWEEIVQSLEMDDIENGIGGVAQPSAGASLSVGLVGNTNEINGDNVAGDAGTTPAAETMVHAPGRSLEEISRWLMEDDIDNGTGGIVQLGAGAWLENNDVIMNDVENMVRVRTGPVEEEENNSGRLEQAVAGASSFGGLVDNTMCHAPGRSLLEDSIDNGTGGVAQPGAEASSSGGLRHNPSETRWSYDVFLSFRGEDTRKNFTDHLYTVLKNEILKNEEDNELLEEKG